MMDSLSLASSQSVAQSHLVSAYATGDDPDCTSSVPTSTEHQFPAKKPIRQWAAWTRQEEESFFNALRQVGKNFEKITRRVQTKNKDQVRHYYYRLVRRMNKFLGPELFLDSKNSKDTNAAMLRWWSLLEKYSCKASKLHLKPRRYKLFVEALETQLMKDKKKNMKKRSMGDNSSPLPTSIVGYHDRQAASDPRMVKFVLVESQNIDKYGAGKGSIKRNSSSGLLRNTKVETTMIKPTRQRRKQGTTSSTAYKRWEKAAIAGVSLVADAAEHLERATTNIIVRKEQEFPELRGNHSDRSIHDYPDSIYCENTALLNMKLKLQLFPIDDATRKALEMDKHNPHLELTLSTKKKISSILEHLNKKWGNSSIADGVLMLFPYYAHIENIIGYQGWTQDSAACASEVYNAIGRPPVFRLRYGWFSKNESGLVNCQNKMATDQTLRVRLREVENVDRIGCSSGNEIRTIERSIPTTSSKNFEDALVEKIDFPASRDIPLEMNAQEVRTNCVEPANSTELCVNEEDVLLLTSDAVSGVEWADSLTNISVGDLLHDMFTVTNHNFVSSHSGRDNLYQTPLTCDSFDAAIAAHISKHQKMNLLSAPAPDTVSIWDAEETCDAFAFRDNRTVSPSISTSSEIALPEENKMALGIIVTNAEPEAPSDTEYAARVEQAINDRLSVIETNGDSEKDMSALTDIYWPDSLGPLDLELPSFKYQGTDLILSDSLSGMNRLLANSLDAFQNCTFMSGQEKVTTNT